MERDCKTCIYSNFKNENDNGCTRWDCEYINRQEAIEAYKEMKANEHVEIKTPHGGLIDRSVLFKEYQNLCKGLLCRDCPFFNERNRCNIEEWILYQPTILEAEA